MHNYIVLVLSLYAILITSCVFTLRLDSRYRDRAPAYLMAVVAAIVCGIAWESLFAAGSLLGVGPYAYSVHSYGYVTFVQPIALFCFRTGLTVALALPVAVLTLAYFRTPHAPAKAGQAPA